MSITPPKSSVNILQEYGTSKYRVLPHYVVKDVSPSIHNPKFQVTVELDKVLCTAEASNKKQAKEMCARMALQELGISHNSPITKTKAAEIDETDNFEDIINFNAVGILNEYASKHRLPYAEYNDVGTNERGLMIIQCSLGEVNAHGLGANKKIAKKGAAAALLKKLKSPAKSDGATAEKVMRLANELVDSTITSTSAVYVKSENIVVEKSTEEIVAVQKSEEENPAEDEAAKNPQKEEIVKAEIVAEEKEALLMEDFRVKLSKLGLKDDNNLVVSKNSSSLVLTYKNVDHNLKIVKIGYDLDKSLSDIYENIKERVE